MNITALTLNASTSKVVQNARATRQLKALIKQLNKRDIPPAVATAINAEIMAVNNFNRSDQGQIKMIRRALRKISEMSASKLKLVPKNYYQNQWMAIGMGAFGIPFGAAIFAATGNAAFIAIGLPIGLAVGIAIGQQKDKQAKDDGRQLNFGSEL